NNAFAAHDHPPAVLHRNIYSLLDPMDVRSKCGDNNSTLDFRKNVVKGPAYFSFRKSEPSLFSIGAVGEQEHRSSLAVFREPQEIHKFPIYRRGVELEITCMNNSTERGLYCKADPIHDTVSDTNKLDGKATEGDAISRPYRHQPDVIQPMLPQFLTHQRKGKGRPEDRDF